MNNSYQPFLPVTMRLKAGTVFIMFPALSMVLTLTAVVEAVAVSTLRCKDAMHRVSAASRLCSAA
ncbi:MAG: hypothetical protein LBL04_07255 [Bacteroidales bacterium]|jgi:hypothetical protein|nr:hypothetical protein [Bacteroidales bacterium]